MKKLRILALLLAAALLSACVPVQEQPPQPQPAEQAEFDPAQLPAYDGEPYAVVNENLPYFTEDDLTTRAYEYFSPLDRLDRCGVVMACIGVELMPTEERGNIGQVKPTGWQISKYDFVDGRYLYNRCHLIGFQLTGENANECNLITGTRYMNVDGMLPFENMVADYVKETENHVLYRVTPVFTGMNPVADGVLMEAYSVEDEGDGICFNVFCYNVQPGVEIDYTTGDNRLSDQIIGDADNAQAQNYILNTNSRKFHLPDCSGAANIRQENRRDYTGTREALTELGYAPCGTCKP